MLTALKKLTRPKCQNCKYYDKSYRRCRLFKYNVVTLDNKRYTQDIDAEVARAEPTLCGPEATCFETKDMGL
jgi:hypothetical protein